MHVTVSLERRSCVKKRVELGFALLKGPNSRVEQEGIPNPLGLTYSWRSPERLLWGFLGTQCPVTFLVAKTLEIFVGWGEEEQ